jgi:trehalose 6-phosphate synthase/phosphatase
MEQGKRIILVSNRLPVTVRKRQQGLEFEPSSGGLATGLGSLRDEFETAWIGWPGRVDPADRKEAEARLASGFGCHPVFMPEILIQKYYEGYSNRAIWPIFHSFASVARHSPAEWEAYKKANSLFGQKILEVYRPGDILWIHDYHLMLLPKYLRDHVRDVTMGFFLHIPFPQYDLFRLIPQHKEILTSLLTLDLVGFHTHDYAQAFLGAVRRSTGFDNTLGQVMAGDQLVQVDVFPMGIDFRKYASAPLDPALREEIGAIEGSLRGRRTLFSVSRLDYTKGIPESLDAVREFLQGHPEWHGKFTYILVVVPSRENVDRYASLKREIDELVGNINSMFGTLEWQPIRYIYRSLTFGELIGLYSNADVALVTPLRDGMNLIAKEYLATRREGTGVLVLSELAGAAKELVEAITVNPNSTQEISQAIHRALTMPVEEQQQRNRVMRERLETYDLFHWIRQFFGRLGDVQEVSHLLSVKLLDHASRNAIVGEYGRASSRLLILDYDGTLVPFADDADAAVPDEQIVALLGKLTAPSGNHVVILSGRDRHTLQRWLAPLDMTIVAEHGGWVRNRGSSEWTSVGDPALNGWKKEIRPILELFVGRIPGSSIEEKDYSLVWHYRKAEQESASAAARELLDTLSTFLANLNIQVVPGSCAVEVRTMGIGKGAFYSSHLSSPAAEFTLAMGDDWTDEDLFSVLPASAYSIKVAPRMSKARFNVKSIHDARVLLEKLASHGHAGRHRPAPDADAGIAEGDPAVTGDARGVPAAGGPVPGVGGGERGGGRG